MLKTGVKVGRRILFTLLRETKMATNSESAARSLTNGTSSSPGVSFESPEIRKFLDDMHKLMIDEALVKGARRDEKVVEFTQPEELESKLDVEITEGPQPHDKLLQACSQVIRYSVKTSHPRFLNQLYAGVNPYSLAGSWLTDCLNTNIHTYEVAPVFVTLERYLFRKLCGIVGYSNGDGIFGPGGSFCNLMAVNLARFRAVPEVKEEGMFGQKRIMLYTSTDAHYSVLKAAMFMGFGTKSLVKVKVDDHGRMIPEELERHVKEDKAAGHLPLFVMGTSGSTVMGSFDDLNKIADICQRHRLWFHADMAWGGGALLNDKYRHLVAGIERTDSLAWNFHKMSNAPIQCSAFLVKEKGLMEKCNRGFAEYLFQPDKFYDVSYDIGDKTVQCGRKVDVVKLWLMWKAIGDKGMAEQVERSWDNSRYFTEKIKKTEGFRLVVPDFQCTNICFWYIPESLRGQEETTDWWNKVAKVAPYIKEQMMRRGTMMIGYQPMASKGLVNFFRIVVEHPFATHEDMDFAIQEIEQIGKKMRF